MSKQFFDFSRSDLEQRCTELGVSHIHAKNLFRRAYKDSDECPWTMDGLPLKLSSSFEDCSVQLPVKILSEHQSGYDGSVKFVVALHDDSQVEMVLMPESKRITLCVSSQVGCAQACTFCHTGRMGLARNLSTAEIVGQVWVANRWISENSGWLTERRLPNFMKVTNVVFMGMGEPLDNVESVANAITILTDPYGPHIAKRRISVSTAGHLDGLEEILKIHPDVRLALSVHSPENSERSKIMPINRKWPLKDILDKLRSLPIQQKQGLLLQYTLISGVNDSDEHAAKLIDLINDMNVKVNLIPLNPVGPSRLKGPTMDRVVQFRDKIYGAGVRVLVRYSKGQDIAAACGQLVVPPKT